MTLAQHSMKSAEWYTPPKWTELVHKVMGGIDLDPASSDVANETVRAERYFTAEHDGLRHPWHGRVFINPPGGGRGVNNLPRCFWHKLRTEFAIGNVSEFVWLAYSLEQLSWLRPALGTRIAIPPKRIKFIGAGDSPTHANAFLYGGPHGNHFAAEFAKAGCLVLRTELMKP